MDELDIKKGSFDKEKFLIYLCRRRTGKLQQDNSFTVDQKNCPLFMLGLNQPLNKGHYDKNVKGYYIKQRKCVFKSLLQFPKSVLVLNSILCYSVSKLSLFNLTARETILFPRFICFIYIEFSFRI